MTRRALLSLVYALIPGARPRLPVRQCLLTRDDQGRFSLTLFGSNGNVRLNFGRDVERATSTAGRFLTADLVE